MLQIPVILLLTILIISDFRTRQVRLSYLLAFGVAQLILAFYGKETRMVVIQMGMNCMLFMVWGIGVVLYYRIFHSYPVKILKHRVGSGDLIFLFFLTPVFSLRGILIFLCTGLLVSLGYCGIDRLVCGRFRSIPLVSTLGCCYVFVLIKNLIF